jgi:hypothetical protein
MPYFQPNELTVYKSPFNKVRMGKDGDGGYIISDVPGINYSILLSGGIAGDISFEEDLIKKYPNMKCYGFDGSIDKLPKENSSITFVKKYIGYHNDDEFSNLHEYINNYDNIFVKMDIEGSEFRWFKSLTIEHLNKFSQIVMEIHFPFTQNDFFKNLNKNHVLIHLHVNNSCKLKMYKGVLIPKVFEVTYLHKKYFVSKPELNKMPLPSNLDMKCVPSRPDYEINHPPFVN